MENYKERNISEAELVMQGVNLGVKLSKEDFYNKGYKKACYNVLASAAVVGIFLYRKEIKNKIHKILKKED